MNIREASFKHLEHRSRTVKEMKDYLIKKEFEKSDIDKEIEYLIRVRYLNDIEYVGQYLRYAFSKQKGLNRIKKELKEKGVSEFDIEDGIITYEEENKCNIKDEEIERAMKVAKKAVGIKEIDKKLLSKLGRKLSALGYDSDTTYKIIGEFMKGCKYE